MRTWSVAAPPLNSATCGWISRAIQVIGPPMIPGCPAAAGRMTPVMNVLPNM